MTIAISVSAVHKQFGALQALKGIDLQVEKGEFFGLLGPNGAGKSTLISIIGGLVRASAGTVSVLGHDVVTEYRQSRQNLGIVPQELVFDPFFTVRESLRIQSGYFGFGRENHDWIDHLIDVLKLSEKANTNMRSLSGGMKRRVLVAQALVHRPQVVVLDEPTAGVDVELRKLLWEFVQGLHRQGHTIVLTTHYLEEAESLCDRIAILNHGKLIALDTKDALLARGIGNTRCLSIKTEQPLSSVPSSLHDKVKQHEGHSLVLQLNRETDSVVDIVDLLRNAGANITDIETQAADLEDVFIELTTGTKS